MQSLPGSDAGGTEWGVVVLQRLLRVDCGEGEELRRGGSGEREREREAHKWRESEKEISNDRGVK